MAQCIQHVQPQLSQVQKQYIMALMHVTYTGVDALLLQQDTKL